MRIGVDLDGTFNNNSGTIKLFREIACPGLTTNVDLMPSTGGVWDFYIYFDCDTANWVGDTVIGNDLTVEKGTNTARFQEKTTTDTLTVKGDVLIKSACNLGSGPGTYPEGNWTFGSLTTESSVSIYSPPLISKNKNCYP